MLAALFAPYAPAPFLFRTVATLGQDLLARRRRTLAAGVEILLPARNPYRVIPFSEWTTQAACRGMEETLFFREDNDAAATRRRPFGESRRVCLRCPVIRDCLIHALTKPEDFGVWGGTHALQRKAMTARIDAGETTLEWELEQCLR